MDTDVKVKRANAHPVFFFSGIQLLMKGDGGRCGLALKVMLAPPHQTFLGDIENDTNHSPVPTPQVYQC